MVKDWSAVQFLVVSLWQTSGRRGVRESERNKDWLRSTLRDILEGESVVRCISNSLNGIHLFLAKRLIKLSWTPISLTFE